MNTTIDNGAVRHEWRTVNGVRLHCVVAGAGPLVVLLHGFPEFWYSWRHQIPVLAQHFTVIAPDMRGYADSSKPYTGYDTQTMAEDIFQLALQLGHQRVSVVGHDVGAAVAYAYAAAHRENVRRLVYIDEPLPGFSYQQFAAFNPDPAGGGGFWWASFHQVPDLPELLIAGQERLYISYFYNLLSFNKGAIDEDALSEYTRAYSMPGAMRASRGFYRDISLSSQQNHESARTKLQMPVLAIGAVPAGAGQAPILDMQAVAENVRPVIIEESGHFIAEEQPDVLNEHLLAFLIEDD